MTPPKMHSAPLIVTILLAVTAVHSEVPEWLRVQPKVKSLHLSSGLYFDHWGGTGTEGNGFVWQSKNRALNPPQSLYSLSAGGSVFLTPVLGLSAGIPIFYNTFEPYTDRSGGRHVRSHRSGIGDFEFGLPIKLGTLTVQPQLAVPGPYDREYLVPWTGFGVYRGSLGASYPWKTHHFWASAERVLYKPRGEDSGLVEVGDFALKGGYAYKSRLARKIQGKAGVDLIYSSFTWQPIAKSQDNFSIDPKVTIAFFPEWKHELAVTLSATLYSTQGGEEDFRSYASRRIFAGFHYGLYL
ncbi:MAG: hypothetical protein M3Y08_03235 [Fibrobacterota bacterium]|nr:hypothetical protein [Fibrobacterota bacterium]